MPIIISGSNGISGVDGTAAAPAVQGTDANTGVYFPAADQVALAANGTQVLLGTSTGVTLTGTQSVSGNLSFNSGFGSAAVAYGCRAWVNFNGTGTPAIRASGNVSSLTDNGTGDYTVNFTNAMPDGNYAVSGSFKFSDDSQGVQPANVASPFTTSGARITTLSNSGTGSGGVPVDGDTVCVIVVR
jgi:hypothetical protein